MCFHPHHPSDDSPVFCCVILVWSPSASGFRPTPTPTPSSALLGLIGGSSPAGGDDCAAVVFVLLERARLRLGVLGDGPDLSPLHCPQGAQLEGLGGWWGMGVLQVIFDTPNLISQFLWPPASSLQLSLLSVPFPPLPPPFLPLSLYLGSLH